MSQDNVPNSSPPLLTREQLRQELNKRGYPISSGYFGQLCLPSQNKGPPIDRWWGKRPLYGLESGLNWAEGRCSRVRPAKAG